MRIETKAAALKGRRRPWSASQLVFVSPEGKPIRNSNFVRRRWNRLQELAKVRRRSPHNLRHTWASQMLAAGADLAYVSIQLGHSSPQITLRIYAHWVPGTKRISSNVLDEKAKKGKKPGFWKVDVKDDQL